LTPSRRRPSE